MDFYLNNDNFYNRLEEYYKKHGKLIILYDFDDTVYSEKYSCEKVKTLIRSWKDYAYLICYTTRTGKELDFVKEYLDKNNIPYNYINRDYMGNIPKDGSKIYGNVMLDDKCGLNQVYGELNKLLNNIKMGKVKYMF